MAAQNPTVPVVGNAATAAPNGKNKRPIRAAAYRIDLKNKKLARKEKARHQAWQDEAWDYFDDLGIIKYAEWFLGNAMAKLRIFAAVRPIDDPEGQPMPLTDPASGIPLALAQRCAAEIERIKGPLGGRGEILRVWNMNLEIAAECYVIGIGATSSITKNDDDADGGEIETIVPESWDIRSIREVDVVGDGEYKIRDEPGGEQRTLDKESDIVVRSYQRHPAWTKLADSNMRGVLSDCEALVLLVNEIKAESKSRQSNGLLLIPNGVTVMRTKGTGGEDDTDPNEDDDDVFDEALLEAMTEPIEDPSSAYSVFPLTVRGEKEDLKEIRHISLSRDTTTLLEERINGRKRAIAEGLNIPVEVALGSMNTTFSNAFQINEDLFEDHLQPRCELICDAWTVGLLQPALRDAGVADELVDRIIVWYSAADMIKRVDPIESADEGHAKGTVSDEAWRRVKGWSEDDAPDDMERLLRAIFGQRSWDPALVDTIVSAFDPSVALPDAQIPAPKSDAAAQGPVGLAAALLYVLAESRKRQGETHALIAARAVKRLAKDNPGRKLAEIDRDLRTKLLVSADRSLLRALERAGIRLKTRNEQNKAVLKMIHPVYAAQRLGPALVAASGINEADLIDLDAFDAFGEQFKQWGAYAQRQALDVVAGAIKLVPAQRTRLAQRQAVDLDDAWGWLRGELHKVALYRLYQPDPEQPPAGEFDPGARVPAGLIRQALARAGGATAIEPVQRTTIRAAAVQQLDTYVAVSNGTPLGGIGTGELVDSAMTEGGALVEAYEWDYGSAFRQFPFEEHEALDGEVFENFDDDVLAGGIFGDSFPGDHDGCLCDFVPTFALPEDLAASQASTEGLDTATAAEWQLSDTNAMGESDTATEDYDAMLATAEQLARSAGLRVASDLAEDSEARDLLSYYAEEGAAEINSNLREGRIPLAGSDMESMLGSLDDLLGTSLTTQDLVVFRGADTDMDAVIGSTITDKGYMSTSLVRDIANGFAEENYVFEITVPSGTAALFMGDVNQYGVSEAEVILGHGHTFAVVGRQANVIQVVLTS